jgi:hypothetical protein
MVTQEQTSFVDRFTYQPCLPERRIYLTDLGEIAVSHLAPISSEDSNSPFEDDFLSTGDQETQNGLNRWLEQTPHIARILLPYDQYIESLTIPALSETLRRLRGTFDSPVEGAQLLTEGWGAYNPQDS